MKIAHVCQNALPKIGGMQIVVNHLIREQQNQGHECVLITRWKPWLLARKAHLPYPCLPLLPRKADPRGHRGSIGAQWKINLMVKLWQAKEKFDVWHIHEVYPLGYQIGKALAKLNVPFVLTSHGEDLRTDIESGIGWRLYSPHQERIKAFLNTGCTLTAISESILSSYLDAGAKQEKIYRIDNGVDFSRLASCKIDEEKLRSHYEIDEKKKIIINVGRNSPIKGLSITEDVISQVNNSSFDTTWFFVGPGMPEFGKSIKDDKIRRQIRTLDSFVDNSGQNHFPSNDLVELLKLADVFYFPTTSEGSPLIVLEAMAVGLPVVSTHASGVVDLVNDQQDGLLNEIGNASQLAESILRMLSDKTLRDSIIQNGVLKAQNYDWSRISSEYVKVYQKEISYDGI